LRREAERSLAIAVHEPPECGNYALRRKTRPVTRARSPDAVNAALRIVNRMKKTADRTDDLWVFGYGSLIWRPGFDFLERHTGRLVGAHRALCVYSFVPRGTPEKPGLVLGLDRGGACNGIVYRVAAKKRAATIDYLRGREQVTMVYREAWRSVWIDSDPQQRVQALCYMVDRGHAQYAGRLTLTKQLQLVRQGHGRSGINRDYVLDTVNALEELGYRDAGLHQLAERLKGGH
jgi:cation transport protein ChaC